MKFSHIALALALFIGHTNANAFFFFFIPGSVVGKITDGITGSEGENCVSSDAKVGGQIRLSNGEIKTVKSLSGTSTRCADAQFPIRALLESSNLPITPHVSSIGIDLPTGQGGWVQRTTTALQKSQGTIFFGSQPSTDSWLLVGSNPRNTNLELGVFAREKLAHYEKVMSETKSSEISRTVINGIPVLQFTVSGYLKAAGTSITYSWTVFDLEKELLVVTTWTKTSNWETEKQSLIKIPELITGLPSSNLKTSNNINQAATPAPQIPAQETPSSVTAPSTAATSTAAPSTAAVVINETPIAKRLRELNDLLKSGLITQIEFEAKKKSILDSL